MQAGNEMPICPRRLDLGSSFAALQEQPPGLWPEERACKLQQTRQGRQGPRAHHVRFKALSAFSKVFNAHAMNVHSSRGLARDLVSLLYGVCRIGRLAFGIAVNDLQ